MFTVSFPNPTVFLLTVLGIVFITYQFVMLLYETIKQHLFVNRKKSLIVDDYIKNITEFNVLESSYSVEENDESTVIVLLDKVSENEFRIVNHPIKFRNGIAYELYSNFDRITNFYNLYWCESEEASRNFFSTLIKYQELKNA